MLENYLLVSPSFIASGRVVSRRSGHSQSTDWIVRPSWSCGRTFGRDEAAEMIVRPAAWNLDAADRVGEWRAAGIATGWFSLELDKDQYEFELEETYRNRSTLTGISTELNFSSEAWAESRTNAYESLFLISSIDRVVQTEERMMFDCALPQVFARLRIV